MELSRRDAARRASFDIAGCFERGTYGQECFKLIDAEMHVMLWQRYIDPEFAARAPRRLDERRWDIRTIVEGELMAQMPGGDWPALTDAEEKALAERYAQEIARHFDPESQVLAMDKEGLDLAVLFPTRRHVRDCLYEDGPALAAAACRASNDWLRDYIQAANPKQMFGAAAISPHDMIFAFRVGLLDSSRAKIRQVAIALLARN